MNIEAIREFLGWCTIINIGVLAFSRDHGDSAPGHD